VRNLARLAKINVANLESPSVAANINSADIYFMNIDSLGPLEQVPCAICGSCQTKLVAVQRWFASEFHVVRCKKCKLIFTSPRPTQIWRERFYDARRNPYMLEVKRDYIYKPTPEKVRTYRTLLRFIKDLVGPGKRLLDGGCATGEFVRTALEEGFDADGLECSPGAVAYAKEHFGLELIQGKVEKAPVPDNTYDVITLLHIIEHFPDPIGALREVRRMLKPGGVLIAETPNSLRLYVLQKYLWYLAPIYIRLYSKRFPQCRNLLPWFPFEHYYHWTPRTLLMALRTAGFEKCDCRIIYGYGYGLLKHEARASFSYSLYMKIIKSTLRISRHKLDLWGPLLTTAVKPTK
jgi:2-polyprenyl-3-methyl-5-hydroxy-6-metoxy-1,4-benzoquinol methylase